MAKGLLQQVTWRSGTLVLLESTLIVGVVVTSAFVMLGGAAWELIVSEQVLPKALVISYTCQLCLYYSELYDDPRLAADRRELLIRLIQALGSTALILSALYYWFPALVIGRGVFAVAAIPVATFVAGWRIVFAWAAQRMGPRERLLLVGTSAAGLDFVREVRERDDLGVEIVGFIDASASGDATLGPGVIGSIEDIPAVVRARHVDRVVVSLADARGKLPMDKLLEMRLDGVMFEHLTSVYEEYTGKIAIENLRPSWLIFSSGFRKSRLLSAAKRGVDVCASAIGLLLALPVLAILAALVKATSKGPVFYRQNRVGQHGRIFSICKLRTMRCDAEAQSGAVWAQRNDPRLTRIGGFLRKARLDEIPQLWNVLAGSMSLIGPRPERPEFVAALTREIPFYGLRHGVKPGVSGWAQVRYTYGASVEDSMQKLQYDLFYIKHLSLWLDVVIAFETIRTVLLRKGT